MRDAVAHDRRRAKEEHDLGSSRLSIASAAVWSACGLELKTMGPRREMLKGKQLRTLLGTRMTRRGSDSRILG